MCFRWIQIAYWRRWEPLSSDAGLTRACGWLLGCVLWLPLWCAFGQGPGTESRGPAEQAEYVVDFWRVEQGLPADTVNALLQTRDGYLWVGTAAGLVRFDGLEFTLLQHLDAPVLQHASITALLEDSTGALWVGTLNQGVYRIENGGVEAFTTDNGLASDSVSSFAQDANGLVWIGTHNGLNFWDQGQLKRFSSHTGLDDEPIVTLHAGRSGVLWITTRFEVYREQNGVAERFEFEEMPQGRNADFVGVYEDRAGKLWTYGATFLLNLSQGRRFNYFRSLDPLSSRVWTICEQIDGGLWIGTSGRGLFRFRDGRFDVAGARDGLDQCDVRALHADQEGNLWIGTSGSGLARLRVQRWRLMARSDGAMGGQLTSMAMSGDGQLYVGSADAGLFHLSGRELKPYPVSRPLNISTHIHSLSVDEAGTLWVGTRGMGLIALGADGRQRQFTTTSGLDDDRVWAVEADAEMGVVWAGTASGGLFQISEAGVTRWPVPAGMDNRPIRCLLSGAQGELLIGLERGGVMRATADGVTRVVGPSELATATVRCLSVDRAGRVWVGTEGAGAFCQVEGRWVSAGQAQGLRAQEVFQIIQDVSGHYWFGTEAGLLQIDEGQITDLLKGASTTLAPLLYRRDVVGERGFNRLAWPSALSAPDGSAWFVMSSGLLQVDPTQVQAMVRPRVMVERVTIDDRDVYQPVLGGQAAELEVEPGSRSLDIDFTAVSFIAPEKIRFRHMLEGFDPDWVDSGVARRAHYGPIPPGRYQFRIVASTADGIWTESCAPLSLIVAPPIWQSWWFIGLAASLATGSLWSLIRYVSLRRLRARLHVSEQRRAMERERARIARDMHDEIGSKLTRISFLSEAARNTGAELTTVGPQVKAIAETSRALMHALDEIVWAVNPRNDNLEHLVGYLEQYVREYFHNTSVDCQVSVPDQLPAVQLSAELRHDVFLAFEEALSNVLRHAKSARVWVTMRLEQNRFEVEVRDEGIGFRVRSLDYSPGHDGLQNMTDRLRAVGGECKIRSQPLNGTTVSLGFRLGPVRTERQS